MPNWKVPSDYTFPKSVGNKWWAWEFLRRNPKYRESWNSYQKELKQLTGEYGPVSSWRTKKLGDDAWWFSPPKLPGESDRAWQSRVISQTSEDPVRIHVYRARAAKWQLRRMADPDSTAASEVEFLSQVSVPVWHRVEDVEMGGTEDQEDRRTGAYLWINLETSLTAQMNFATAKLRRLKRQLVKHGVLDRGDPRTQDKKLLTHYLRIWDAKESGATVKDIGAEMYSHIKNVDPDYRRLAFVRERIKQARRMVDRGYVVFIR